MIDRPCLYPYLERKDRSWCKGIVFSVLSYRIIADYIRRAKRVTAKTGYQFIKRRKLPIPEQRPYPLFLVYGSPPSTCAEHSPGGASRSNAGPRISSASVNGLLSGESGS